MLIPLLGAVITSLVAALIVWALVRVVMGKKHEPLRMPDMFLADMLSDPARAAEMLQGKYARIIADPRLPAHHVLRLHPEPFAATVAGTKYVESRLNDEKRRAIAVGDTLEFVSRENPDDRVLAKVAVLHRVPVFEDLAALYPPGAFGAPDVATMLTDVKRYYADDDIARYGVIGIRFKLLQE